MLLPIKEGRPARSKTASQLRSHPCFINPPGEEQVFSGEEALLFKIRIFRTTLRTSGRAASGEGREKKKTDKERPKYCYQIK